MTEYFLPRQRPDDAESEIELLDTSDGVRTTESDRGLEIELPQGQRVTVGALPPGTILEIISWQGTGAPKSDASRLLLGAIVAGPDAAMGAVPPGLAPVSTPAAASEAGAAPMLGSADTDAPRVPPRAGGTMRRIRSLVRTLAAAAVVVAIVLAPQIAGVASWSVIDEGPEWALGSTRGSLVLASLSDSVSGGDRVTFRPEGAEDRWLGFAVATPTGELSVRSGSVTLPGTEGARRVYVIVPWVGSVVRLVAAPFRV
jgi:hypothetical protein